MKAFKKYGWILKLIGAALMIGLAVFMGVKPLVAEGIVIPFIGAAIIIYSVIRLVPFVKTQKNDLIKTMNIMEITIDIALGLAMILITLLTLAGLGNAFGYLLGGFFILRGSIHFYSVSTGAEKSDLPLYLFHILALVIGSYIFTSGNFTPAVLVWIILFFSVVAGGYLSYDGYKGYKVYRYQKTLEMPDVSVDEEAILDKKVPIIEEEEEHIQDQVVS
ncbi:MAG: hypothetical protein J7K80_00520 [Candidatus Izimaplasma sp.]|nr:hypothetical protein [Candidatus Izimaplasma bacterium]